MSDFGVDLAELKRAYIQEAEEGRQRYDFVYIYGAGRIATLLHALLAEQNIEINGFCVTDKQNNRSEIEGLPVKQINELDADKDKTLFLIGTMREKSGDMIRELERFGYKYYLVPPEKVNYLNSKKIEMRNRPTLEITPKIGCSIHCRYCPQDVLYKEYFSDCNRSVFMDFELYKQCVDKTPLDCIIIFAGFVEPFLHQKAVEMMQYAAGTGRDVSLYTTLVGMSKAQFDKIKNIPFYEVVLHTPDEEEFANIPLTTEYFELLDEVLEARKPDGSPFVDYANCQGVPHEAVLKHTTGKLLITSELVDRAGNIVYEEVYEDCHKKGHILCERTRRLDHNILLPDGSVVLCCMDFGMKHVLGNLARDSYTDLFQGDVMQGIKKAMRKDGMEIICRQCSSAIEVDGLGKEAGDEE